MTSSHHTGARAHLVHPLVELLRGARARHGPPQEHTRLTQRENACMHAETESEVRTRGRHLELGVECELAREVECVFNVQQWMGVALGWLKRSQHLF